MDYKELQIQLNYKFNNLDLLELALTHKSYSSSSNNERLEFLGDSILNSIISEYLFGRFPNQKEGLLTRDPRMVERKKFGQKKARKKFQFSKR